MYNIHSNLRLVGTEFTNFSDITDEHLKSMISDIRQEMPDIGQSMLKGVLNSRGIHVSTVRLRECLSEVDPINSALRWKSPIRRRVYSVPYPNALWHIDGNHKLVRYVELINLISAYIISCSTYRWRLIVHGGIDGFSRFIVYLCCSNNNKSETVFHLFEDAIRDYGLPDHVRSDKGGENIKVRI